MIDQFGLIVQEDGDGGDCPCRCGVVIGRLKSMPTLQTNWQAEMLISATQRYLRTPTTGLYFRYPTGWNSPNDFSRDQASRLMLGYGIAGKKVFVESYYKDVVLNLFRHPNGDFLGTGEPGNIIRSLNWWVLWPLLFFFDIKFLWDVSLGVKINPWDSDNLFVMDLYFAQKKFWTPVAWLASKLYDKNAARARVTNNLLNYAKNPCKEAGLANLWFLENM